MVKCPKFSVIIPVYNVENYLSQCLDSVINQTIYDIEIICVNDGTKDSSKQILDKYRKMDSRIQVIDKKNGGLSSARNYGLKKATGNYILFLDSDDYIENKACERLYYEILESKPDIIVFGSHIFPVYPLPDPWLVNNLSPRTVSYQDDSINALINENCAVPFVWRNCFKREFLINYQLCFNEKVRFAEDLIFQFMAFPLAKNIVFISDKLYHYRCNRENSLMFNASKNQYMKYCQHIAALKIIADYWEQHGFFRFYKTEFMKWSVSFMGWDLYAYKGYKKKKLLKELCDFWDNYGLTNSIKKLSLKQKYFFYYIRINSRN